MTHSLDILLIGFLNQSICQSKNLLIDIYIKKMQKKKIKKLISKYKNLSIMVDNPHLSIQILI
jgi:hypothetical protein